MFLNNMHASKSPYCHKTFIFSELFDNLILIKHGVKEKQEEEKEGFYWSQKTGPAKV